MQNKKNNQEIDIQQYWLIIKRRWLFIFTKKTKHSLLEIKNAQVEWEKHKSTVYRITLTLTSGKKLPLSTYHANYLKSAKNIEATAAKIRNFLSLPSN